MLNINIKMSKIIKNTTLCVCVCVCVAPVAKHCNQCHFTYTAVQKFGKSAY